MKKENTFNEKKPLPAMDSPNSVQKKENGVAQKPSKTARESSIGKDGSHAGRERIRRIPKGEVEDNARKQAGFSDAKETSNDGNSSEI